MSVDANFRHAVNEFVYRPTVASFRELRMFFRRIVDGIMRFSGIVVKWDASSLVGYLFRRVGGYREGSAFTYFTTKLLIHMRRLYRLEKGIS
jgi:hypothetical protein